MNTIGILKKILLLVFFISSTSLLAQNIITLNEELPPTAEKLNIIIPRSSWFGKSKVTIENFGIAIIKEGSTSTSISRKKGVSKSKTKFKFSITLTNTANGTASLTGSTVENDEYVVYRNTLFDDLFDLGIESETISEIVNYPKVLNASIVTDLEDSVTWNFLLRTDDQDDASNLEIGLLTNGERIIYVIQTNLENLKNINDKDLIHLNTPFHEFIENGVSLGAVTYENTNSTWLKPDLDPLTKLILCTAMLSIAY